MQAAAIDRFGGAEEIKSRDMDMPKPEPGEVLIRIDTAGVGAWDPYVRDGQYFKEVGGEPRFPFVLGVEAAGVIEALGEGVEGFSKGQPVYTYSEDMQKGGFYAEYATVKADLVASLPKGLELEAAGAMPADAITALCGLEALDLEPGETLAIFGASGGIGHIALQLAQRMGAKVLAIASGNDGVELVRRLGADAAVDGHGNGVAKAVKEFAPDGLDAALVTASDKSLGPVLEALHRGARIAFPHGVEPEPKAPRGVKIEAYDGESTPERLERLNRLIEKAPFHVHVSARYRLDQAAEAHRAVEKHHLGKIALKIAPDSAH
jgi:NADPH:quinone reductase-like Zn-dependent oxidoreductase